MRRTLIGLVAGIALIAAACGGDDSDDGDAETAAETTETTAGSDTGDDGAAAPAPAGEPGEFADTPFCEEFLSLEAGDDEAELVATLRSLDPPEKLQTDMTTLADSLEELSALDLDDPEALNEPENQETFAAFQQAGLNIQTSCTEGPPPGAAPPDDGSGDAPEDG